MAEQRKRLTKKASKILFEIICEDSFEGKSIKTILPATRRISKTREGLWEYVRSELVRRSEEEYDLGTVSAAWYYNLRKIGSCLDQIDVSADNGVRLEKLRTMERYVCNNLGDRIRGRGKRSVNDEPDIKLTRTQMLTLSRQSTMDATVNYSFDVAPLHNLPVKKEKGSSNEGEGNAHSQIQEGAREDDLMDDTGMRDDAAFHDGIYDPIVAVENLRVEANDGVAFDLPSGDAELALIDGTPIPSRYNTPDTTFISRNNSTMSVSGYDADNEKGLIKRRRKELKKREERERVVKVEEVMEEGTEEGNEGEKEEVESEEDGEGMGERESGEERSQKMKMLDSLKGMVENLRDHIVSLRIIGAIDAVDMESLVESFENAGQSISNNMDIA